MAAVLAAVAVLAGCGAPSAPRPAGPPPTTTVEQAVIASPAEISVPSIEVTSTLVELGFNADRTVEVPPVAEPMQAGWFTGAPKPGEPGPAVILGHVNGGGHAGVFARLEEVAVGDDILVGRTDGTTVRFTATRVDQVPKSAFPTEAVYGDTTGPELRLITCGGTFDRDAHSYRDNVIVYAAIAP